MLVSTALHMYENDEVCVLQSYVMFLFVIAFDPGRLTGHRLYV